MAAQRHWLRGCAVARLRDSASSCWHRFKLSLCSRIIGKGLALANRYARPQVPLHDVPGALMRLSQIVADCRVNIIHIEHDRLSTEVPINHTLSTLHMEVRGREHLEELIQILLQEGYEVRREEA